MYSEKDTAHAVGFPIRKSVDHRSFAPPHSLSQRNTSFIASSCQGILEMPFCTYFFFSIFLKRKWHLSFNRTFFPTFNPCTQSKTTSGLSVVSIHCACMDGVFSILHVIKDLPSTPRVGNPILSASMTQNLRYLTPEWWRRTGSNR